MITIINLTNNNTIMKRVYLLLMLLLIGTMPLKADEGLWMLNALEKYNIGKMQELGCKLDAQAIYDINNSSLKDAVVQFGEHFERSSGTVISNNGLFITSHNAAYKYIHKLSSLENNYLNNGFWAKSQSEEIPVKGLIATFMVSITDVTEQMLKANKRAENMSLYDAHQMFRYVKKKLCKEVTKGDETLIANVVEMDNKNTYYVVVRKIYKDVRLVAAPPVETEFYTPENDNGVWPRKGNFAIFRIYADAKNNPAEYSPDNKPYTPAKSVPVSLKGIEENGFVMSLGYPDQTSRNLLPINIEFTRDMLKPIYIQTNSEKAKVLEKLMRSSQQMKLALANEYAQTLDAWMKAQGCNNAIDMFNVIQTKSEQQQKFTDWVNSDPQRMEKYGDVISGINEYTKSQANSKYLAELINATINSIQLLQPANPTAHRLINYKEYYTNFYNNYNIEADKELAKLAIKLYLKSKPQAYAIPTFYNTIGSRFNGDIDAYVEYVFANSVFTTAEGFFKAVAGKTDLSGDPARILRKSINDTYGDFHRDWVYYKEDLDPLWDKYTEALMEMNGENPAYPDVVSTYSYPIIRLTYGKITAPATANETSSTPDSSASNTFLSNCDIVDGSYGSGMLNANGELVGIAFGATTDSMAGEYFYEPDYQRCAGLDIRYIIDTIKKNIPELLNELNITQ